MKPDQILPVMEVTLCLQGEGPLTGVPHFLIRTTGCTMRCCWGNVPCDTWYTSHKPEKGTYSLEAIEKIISDNPLIDHVFITGGSPTMHVDVFEALIRLCNKHILTITVETEGSVWHPYLAFVDYISLSPKLATSTPIPGTFISQLGRELRESDAKRHEKFRKNYQVMESMMSLDDVKGYVKFVVSRAEDLLEIEHVVNRLNLSKDQVYLMPMGADRKDLARRRLFVSELCISKGWNYTDRLHIIIHGDKRGV